MRYEQLTAMEKRKLERNVVITFLCDNLDAI